MSKNALIRNHNPTWSTVPDTSRNSRALRVGIMGYYGFGNLGDEVIFDCLAAFLAPNRVVPIQTGFQATRETIAGLNTYDFLILGGGGLFSVRPPSPFDSFDSWKDSLHCPIVGLGLGVESLHPDFARVTECLIESSRFFQVRDRISQEILNHPKVVVAPDLTFFRPLPQVNSLATNSAFGINLRPTRTGVENWVNAVSNIDASKLALPFSTRATFDDRIPLSRVASIRPGPLDLNVYSSLKVVVAMALHAVIFAVQSGIPVVAIDYNAKVRRFMEEVGLADYVLGHGQDEKLQEVIDKTLMDEHIIRIRCQQYTQTARARISHMLDEVKEEIEFSAHRRFEAAASFSGPPLVSILVFSGNETEGHLEDTLRSCIDQLLDSREIIVVGKLNHSVKRNICEKMGPGLKFFEPTRTDPPGKLIEALSECRGQFIAAISEGAILVHDAISTMVLALSTEQERTAAYADHYLQDEGVIEQYVDTARSGEVSILGGDWPYFLALRSALATEGDVWNLLRSLHAPMSGASHDPLHVPRALMQKPTNKFESCMFRSAVSYAQKEFNRANELVRKAVEGRDSFSHRERERFLQIFVDTGFQQFFVQDPSEYWAQVLAQFPSTTTVLAELKRDLTIRTSLELAYLCRQHKKKVQAIRMYGRAMRYDRRRLVSRSSWRFLATTLLEFAS